MSPDTVVWLRDCSFADCDRLLAEARSVGLGLYLIEPHYINKPSRPGLLLGYAGLSTGDITVAMRLFGRCLANLKKKHPRRPIRIPLLTIARVKIVPVRQRALGRHSLTDGPFAETKEKAIGSL